MAPAPARSARKEAPGKEASGKEASGKEASGKETRGKAVIVHSIDQARAALAAAGAADVRVTLMSGRDAAAYLGPRWFSDLVDLAAAEYPGVTVDSLLDCGDRAGLVLAALRVGLKQVRFTGSRSAAVRLGQIAAAQGATVIVRRPVALDLLDHPDPARACREWLSGSDRSR